MCIAFLEWLLLCKQMLLNTCTSVKHEWKTPISLPGYIKNIVVSSIEQFLALCTYLLSFSASLYLATVTYYSSAIVHKEALKPGIRTVFEKSNIEVRRISVGCSCIQLISSVSPLFWVAQTRLNNLMPKAIIPNSSIVRTSINSYFGELWDV